MIKLVISIRNIREMNNFLRWIPFYRSILGQFFFLEVRDSYLPISSMVIALNTKNRKERVRYIYDYLCTTVDHFYQGSNYCQFCHNRCLVQQRIQKFENGCCRRCIHITSSGCSTQNLTCKMFQCQSIKEQHAVISWDDFSLLYCLSLRQQLILKAEYFATREEILRDLQLGSLFISAFFIIYRFLFQTLIKRKK